MKRSYLTNLIPELFLFLVGIGISACGGSVEADILVKEVAGSDAGADAEATLDGVQVLDSGYWLSPMDCEGQGMVCRYGVNIWVDLLVQSDLTESVHVTLNNGATVQAQFEGSAENGYERWGIDYQVETTDYIASYQDYSQDSMTSRPFNLCLGEIEFEAFAGGTPSRAKSGPVMLRHTLSAKAPMILGYAGPVNGNTMNLSACVLGTTELGKLFVRFTRDAWASYKDIEITSEPQSAAESKDTWVWHFGIQGELTPSVPNGFRFMLRYESGGQEYWDDNSGLGYDGSGFPALQ